MLDVVTTLSGKLIKLNSSDDHRISSSESLDKCIIDVAIQLAKSIIKSLSLTPSILFLFILEKHNSLAKKFLSIL